jgi:general secretion pathway protein D
MKMKVTMAVCGLAICAAVSAQESSRTAPAGSVEIADLVAAFARRAQKPFVVDARARGPVTLAGVEPGQITYDQLLATLSVNGISVVDSGGILSVVPDANARQFPTPIYTDTAFKASDYEIVSLLVTPRKVCANFLVPVLRPLMPQAAHLAAEIQTNTLIINDRADNARRIAELVDLLDKRGTGAKDCQPGEPAKAPVKPKD